jgi:uncharacterized protein (TIGR02145 family)
MRNFMPLAIAIMVILPYCKKDKKGLPSLTTTAATNVTATSLTTGGNITSDGGQGISKRGICWANHTGPTVADSITNDGSGGGSFTSNLTNLGANTIYYIRAYASNPSGTAYGDEIMVTTSQGVPSVTTTAISNIQPLSAVSGGNVTNDGGASVTERGVVYSTTANPTISNNKITGGTGTGTFTVTLSPLASQQTYYVRAYATNSNGTAYGNQVQFNASSANTVTDIDGNVYPYITLCGVTITTVNLKTTKYRNGDAITNGSDTLFNWHTNTNGTYTYPNYKIDGTSRNAEYGKLYDLAAVRSSKGLCPTGWHVASDTNWANILICKAGLNPSDAYDDYVPAPQIADLYDGGSSGLNLKNAGEAFINYSTGLVVGYSFGKRYQYWTSTPNPYNVAQNWFRVFNVYSDPIMLGKDASGPGNERIISVRCVKD